MYGQSKHSSSRTNTRRRGFSHLNTQTKPSLLWFYSLLLFLWKINEEENNSRLCQSDRRDWRFCCSHAFIVAHSFHSLACMICELKMHKINKPKLCQQFYDVWQLWQIFEFYFSFLYCCCYMCVYAWRHQKIMKLSIILMIWLVRDNK